MLLVSQKHIRLHNHHNKPHNYPRTLRLSRQILQKSLQLLQIKDYQYLPGHRNLGHKYISLDTVNIARNTYSLAVFYSIDQSQDLSFNYTRAFIVLDIFASIAIQTLFLYIPYNMYFWPHEGGETSCSFWQDEKSTKPNNKTDSSKHSTCT